MARSFVSKMRPFDGTSLANSSPSCVVRSRVVQLLERELFLAQLADLAADARRGQGQLVIISGEAGIGKSALVDAFAATQPDRVLWGACDTVTPARPFAPVLDMAEQVGGDLREALRDGNKHRTSEVFLSLLRGPDAPALVVFEDVQWADEATLDLLRVVGRRLRTLSVLIVATCRDDDVGAGHPLRLTLGDIPASSTTTVRVPPLSAAAVRLLTEGTGIDGDALYAAAGGNPFFVTEVVAAGGQAVPATVRDAVWARASRLSAPARQALSAASVTGRCDGRIVRTVADVGDDAVAECVARGMLVASGAVLDFRHELARRAVLEGLGGGERLKLERRALAVWRAERGDVDPARLAQHAVAAGDADAALEFVPAAARRAAALGAHREAAALYETVLPFANRLDPAARARLLEAHARERFLTADVAAAISSQEEALVCWQGVGDGRGEGACTRSLAYLWWCAGEGNRARELAAGAVTLLESRPPGPELAGAYATLAQLTMTGGHDHRAAVAFGQRAVELGEKFGEEQVVVHALNTIGTARVCMDDARGWADLEESLARARAAHLDEDVSRAFANLVAEARHTRQYGVAERHLPDALRYTAEYDLDLNRKFVLGYQAEVALEQGRWDDAAGAALEALERVGPGAATARVQAMTVLARLRMRRGEADPWPLLDAALALALPQNDLLVVCPLRAARAEAAWLEGDNATAAAEAGAGLAVVLEHTSSWWRGELAFWAWKAAAVDDRPDGCAEPYELHMDGRFLEAAAAWEAIGCPYQRALALADSSDEADQREALAAFHVLGARPAAALAAARLRAQGARRIPRGPRSPTRANPAGLTPREMEVLALVADGLRNTEIADRLVVSPKTVDHHVSTVLAKLGVPNRQAAARQAARLGLQPGEAGRPR
jgi:DNA-binding NarL/FixJ family response regulator